MSTIISFIGEIFSQLQAAADTRILAEIREGEVTGVTGVELLELVRKARTFIASKNIKKGERCGLLAANSIRWVAMDLAIMAEGLIVVPLYSRQAPAELVAMMKDSTPALVCCGDTALREGIAQSWTGAPQQFLFDEIFASVGGVHLEQAQVENDTPVTIIYTSGTSGEAKGCLLYTSSSGVGSQTFRDITKALALGQNKRAPVFVPVAERPFAGSVNFLANRKGAIGKGASLMKVFMPYLTWNTVFDNTRVTKELGKKPVPFSEYCYPLLKFSRENNFAYRYRPWPAAVGGTAA